jgi:hypothetical protein
MRKSWTEQEVEIIKTMYPDNLTENLLPFLPGRSISKIMGKANLMGMKKSALFLVNPKVAEYLKKMI